MKMIKIKKDTVLFAVAYSMPFIGLAIQKRRAKKRLDTLTTSVANDLTRLAEHQNELIDALNMHDDAIVMVHNKVVLNDQKLKALKPKKKKRA